MFLFGMKLMGDGLELVAGSRLKGLLEKITSNPLLGILVGVVVTGAIQSSSATTVMVVGFLNAGLLKLEQSVYIIMGANIGTTVTSFLIGLKINAIAPVLIFIGVIFVVFIKKKFLQHLGMVIVGFGILFTGMEGMSSAMVPLREMPAFRELMVKFSNPVLGILAGAVLTAVIQSSSASVGILQALALSGVIGLDSAVYVLFGQNIGTCITAVLASIGTSRSAKRATIIHLMFNIIGTVLFTILCILFPLADLVASFTPDAPAAQIANMHTIFNIGTTLLLLPAGNLLAGMAEHLLPDKKSESLAAEQRKAACKKVEDVWNS